MKSKIKTKQVAYTLEPLNRNFRKPTFASTTLVVFEKIKKTIIYDMIKFYIGKVSKYVIRFNNSPTVRLYLTNGRKHNQREKLEAFCRDFNRKRQTMRIIDHFGNPEPYNEAKTQMFINELKFGKW